MQTVQSKKFDSKVSTKILEKEKFFEQKNEIKIWLGCPTPQVSVRG